MKKLLLLFVLICSVSLYSQNGEMLVDIYERLQIQNDKESRMAMRGTMGINYDANTLYLYNEDGTKITYRLKFDKYGEEDGYSAMQGNALEIKTNINLQIKISNHMTTNSVIDMLTYELYVLELEDHHSNSSLLLAEMNIHSYICE